MPWEDDLHALLDTPAAFSDWLAAQADRAIVGERGRTDSCPVARFLAATLADNPGLLVGVDYLWRRSAVGSMASGIHAPGWVRRFVEAIDKQPHTEVRCTTARRVLAEVRGAE